MKEAAADDKADICQVVPELARVGPREKRAPGARQSSSGLVIPDQFAAFAFEQADRSASARVENNDDPQRLQRASRARGALTVTGELARALLRIGTAHRATPNAKHPKRPRVYRHGLRRKNLPRLNTRVPFATANTILPGALFFFLRRGNRHDRSAVIAPVDDERRPFLAFRQGRVVRGAASALCANGRRSIVVFLRHSRAP